MGNIINRSNHPVEIKRVELQIWKLRDEIECAIENRIKETGHSDEKPVDIDDIKSFYLSNLNGENSSDEGANEGDESEDDSNLDSSGNPMDDDAMAMMAALGGGGDEDGESDDAAPEEAQDEAPEEESSETPEDNPEGAEEESEEDDEAAAMAAAMLADQGLAPAADGEEVKEEDIPKEEEKVEVKPFKRKPPKMEKIVEGFVFLSDVQMDQIMLFAKDNFVHGQNIVIKFLVPKPFSITAEVISATNIARNSRIISSAKPDFRIQSVFNFQFPGERGNLRAFLQSIEPDIPDPPKKLRRPDNDDDDDFDDLGF